MSKARRKPKATDLKSPDPIEVYAAAIYYKSANANGFLFAGSYDDAPEAIKRVCREMALRCV